MKLFIGLGNYGDQYAHTRHNAGFEVIDRLSDRWHIPVTRARCHGLIGEGTVGGERVALIKPQTYMNLSGDCVAAALQWYKVQPQDVMIFSDDIDLELGTLRVRPFGGSGTHNGWRDILLKTGSDRFPRIRIGVGARPTFWNLADWVLSKFTPEEQTALQPALEQAAEAASLIVQDKMDQAMNRFSH